jgi:hypothetical protein
MSAARHVRGKTCPRKEQRPLAEKHGRASLMALAFEL